jgi:hypothetical protein
LGRERARLQYLLETVLKSAQQREFVAQAPE